MFAGRSVWEVPVTLDSGGMVEQEPTLAHDASVEDRPEQVKGFAGKSPNQIALAARTRLR